MVLFTTKFFRKLFYSKFSSVYVNKIVQLLLKSQADDESQSRDDDLRGNSILFTERIGTYDGLSSAYLVPKTGTTINYWTSKFPDKNFIGGWWIFDHVFHAYSAGIGYVRDVSYFDRHARVYGNPCIVSGGSGLILPWRPDSVPSLVANCDGVADHFRVADHSDFRVSNGSFSWVFVINPQSFASTNQLSKWTIELNEDKWEDNDYIQCGNQAGLWSQSLTKFSFSLWVKPTLSTSGEVVNNYIVSHGNESNQGFRLMQRVSDGKFVFVIKDSSGVEHFAESDDNFDLDTWYHIVCVYDNSLGSDNIKLYIDGVLQAVKGTMTQAINLSDELTLSTEIPDSVSHVRVKKFEWWTTIPLTQTDIDNLFDGDVGLVTDPNFALSMNEGHPHTSLFDNISGVTATLVNGPQWYYDEEFPSFEPDALSVLVTKRDDASNKYTIGIKTDGKIYADVRKSATDYNAKSTSALSLNTWYWIVVTFDTATNTIKIWVNATDVTTTGIDLEDNDNLGTAFNDVFLLSTNRNAKCPKFAVYLIGFERGNAMNSTEITNLFNNKCSMGNDTGEDPAWINFAIPQ